jgi:hypothetical protein
MGEVEIGLLLKLSAEDAGARFVQSIADELFKKIIL